MAKSKFGILGPVSGKLGPVVGGVWKGIPYLRLAPEEGKGKKLRTAAQLANEGKMTFMNNVLVPFHAFINIGFQQLAIHKTALSVAYSINYHNALTGVYPDLEIDYSKFAISSGPLSGLKNPVVVLAAPDRLTLSWENQQGSKTRFDDQLMLVVYSPALHTVQGMAGGAIRRDLTHSLALSEELIGQTLEVYVTVTSFDRRKVSNSAYLGRILP